MCLSYFALNHHFHPTPYGVGFPVVASVMFRFTAKHLNDVGVAAEEKRNKLIQGVDGSVSDRRCVLLEGGEPNVVGGRVESTTANVQI